MSLDDRFGDQSRPKGKYPEKYGPALDLLNELEEALDDINAEHPFNESADDFVESMREKVESFMVQIKEWQSATPNQMNALQNMLTGARKWLR